MSQNESKMTWKPSHLARCAAGTKSASPRNHQGLRPILSTYSFSAGDAKSMPRRISTPFCFMVGSKHGGFKTWRFQNRHLLNPKIIWHFSKVFLAKQKACRSASLMIARHKAYFLGANKLHLYSAMTIFSPSQQAFLSTITLPPYHRARCMTAKKNPSVWVDAGVRVMERRSDDQGFGLSNPNRSCQTSPAQTK